MDLSGFTDAELQDLEDQINDEQQARILLANGPQIAESLAQATQAARERDLAPGEHVVWVQPTGAHDCFPMNALVSHVGKVWRSTTPANVWEPGVSGWEEVVEGGGPSPWIQPTGTHDAYYLNPTEGQKGPTCTHVGRIWRTLVDANVWEPSAASPTLWADEGPS